MKDATWLELASENARLRRALLVAEGTIFTLEQRLRDAMPGEMSAPPEWQLTAAERRLVALLLQRKLPSRHALLTAWYANKPGRVDEVAPKILDVLICKIRKKLKAFGVGIKVHIGAGYYLEAADKARLLAHIDQAPGR